MATLDVTRLHVGAISDPTQATDPAFWQPYSILATNDVWKHGVWVFGSNNAAEPTVDIGIYGLFVVPQNYVGTPVWVVDWTSTITSGQVVWRVQYRTVAGNDTTSLDQSGTEESHTFFDAAPTAAHRLLTITQTSTAANFAAGDVVEWALHRLGTDTTTNTNGDNLAGSAILHNFRFRYNDA